MAPIKKGGKKKKKKSYSAINEGRRNIINVHQHIHGVAFKKTHGLSRDQKVAMKEMRMPDASIHTRFNKAVWVTVVRNVPCSIHVQLSRKCNEEKESPHKFYTLVTYVLGTVFKNLQIVNVDEN
ncbi:60S ribosomal protein L31-like [Choloepus didactylus]|uniref:60S ribosomal protein L31-like n=1 Tax=Choloepus didactylus TaxID=27675 RepID=UPI0018A0E820|nr:60S ribosomal protein L31-like [Choloepus didactylus]